MGYLSSVKFALVFLMVNVVKETASIPTPTDASDDELVDALVHRFWQWRLKESPEYGTKIGNHDNDHLVEEYTEEAFIRQKVQAESFLTETMRLLDNSSLSQPKRTDLLILQHNLLAFCEGYEFRSYGMYNPFGLVRSWLQLMSFMPKDTEHDYQNILARYRALPKQIDDQIVLMRKSVELGHTYHASTMEAMNELGELKDVAEAAADESSFFILPFRAIPFTLPHNTRTELMHDGYMVVQKLVLPAWGRLYQFLSSVYMNNTRPGIGVSTMPGGERFYQAALKWHTTTDLTPLEVHEMGLREVERLSRLMADLVQQMGFNGTTKEYIALLKSDSKNFYKTGKAMVRQYHHIVDRVHRKLKRVLKFIPTTNVTIRGFSSASAALGYYLDPPLDGSRPGYFYANIYEPETKAKFEMLPLTLHEAEPGHHTMCAYAIDMDLPNFRTAIEFRKVYAIPFNWPFMTASIEGWALYAETLHDEMKLHNNDPLTLLGLYSSEIFRATRLVVDTGIHVLGWSEEHSETFISNYTTFARHLINAEVKRYVHSPAQACAYKIGELTFKGLREEAEEALGPRFDLREYHHQLLRLGPTPLSVVKNIIKQWIKDEKEKMLMEAGSGEPMIQVTNDVMVIPQGQEITVYTERESEIIEFTETDLMMNESRWMSRLEADHTLSYDTDLQEHTLAGTAADASVTDAEVDITVAKVADIIMTSRGHVETYLLTTSLGMDYDVTAHPDLQNASPEHTATSHSTVDGKGTENKQSHSTPADKDVFESYSSEAPSALDNNDSYTKSHVIPPYSSEAPSALDNNDSYTKSHVIPPYSSEAPSALDNNDSYTKNHVIPPYSSEAPSALDNNDSYTKSHVITNTSDDKVHYKDITDSKTNLSHPETVVTVAVENPNAASGSAHISDVLVAHDNGPVPDITVASGPVVAAAGDNAKAITPCDTLLGLSLLLWFVS